MIKGLFKKAIKIPWRLYGKWTTPLLMDAIISEALSRPYLSAFGYKEVFKHYLVIDGEYYWDEREHQHAKHFFERALERGDTVFLEKFYKFNLSKTKKANAEITHLLKTDVNILTDKKLTALFESWVTATQPLMHLNTLFIPLDEVIGCVIREKLIDALSIVNKKNINPHVLLTELTPPRKLAYMIKEEDDLLLIASEICKNKKLIKKFFSWSSTKLLNFLENNEPKIFRKIIKHHQQYCWLAVVDWLGPLFDYNYYLERLKGFIKKDPSLMLKKRIMERKQREQFIRKKIKEIEMSSDLKKMIRITRNLIDLDLKQWDSVSMSGYFARPMLIEIGRRLGMGYEEALQLTPSEVENLLKKETKIAKNVLKSRLSHRAILRVGLSVKLFYGSEALKLRKLILKEKKDFSDTLKGAPSFAGFVKGYVRIIPTLKEVAKMQDGEILVCPMTNPDYMPAIRKARAIVTDQGGILAHASIVSRELKIPCIVGTKVATQALKDGDEVEVDADKGIVKKLK